jgi:hypothetical protein
MVVELGKAAWNEVGCVAAGLGVGDEAGYTFTRDAK